jgi:trimeric autotransporter adhesin
MRTGLIELGCALVLVSTMAAAGCSEGGSGTTGTAGSGGGSTGTAGSMGGTTGSGGTGGTTGTGGSAGGGSVTSISASKTLGSLTAAESDQLCDDTKAYFMTSISKANSCKFSALSMAASTSAPSDAVLRTNCTSMETSCNASATMGPGATTSCFAPPATCTATVAQYSACISDQAALLNQSANTLPSCSAVRLADISPIFGAVEAFYTVPGCMALMNECPSFVFPIAN